MVGQQNQCNWVQLTATECNFRGEATANARELTRMDW